MKSTQSVCEADYIARAVERGIRGDGRGCLDTRQVYLELGLYPQSSGSCRVSLDGGTDVLVGVRAAVGEVEEVGQSVGRVVVSVEWYVLVHQFLSLQHANGASSPSARIYHDKRELEDICTLYSQFLTRTLNGPHGGLDLSSLCIIPSKSCWIINVDVLILDWGRENIPLSVTLSRIGNGQVVDCSAMEELCSSSRLSVIVNSQGQLCGMQKDLNGCLDPSVLVDMVEVAPSAKHQVARNMAIEHIGCMDKYLLMEEQRKLQGMEPVGFR
ncbi:Exosome complex component RRP42 [Kappamyces sp. JEL0680]|nr:Exosome complex component RRP42 [Kappamyces sp. JEL0680]